MDEEYSCLFKKGYLVYILYYKRVIFAKKLLLLKCKFAENVLH